MSPRVTRTLKMRWMPLNWKTTSNDYMSNDMLV